MQQLDLLSCAAITEGGLPLGDMMLAQKFALELFETDAVKVAKRPLGWDDALTADLRVTSMYCRRFRPKTNRR